MKRILLALLIAVGTFIPATALEQATQKTTDHAPEPKTSNIDQVILEEYKAVRAEIILCLEGRVSIVSLGFAAVGALLAGGVAALSRDKPYWLASALIIGIGVTLTSLYVFDVWTVETRRLARASDHNCYLEKKINKLFPGEVKPLEWENRIRNDENYKSLMPTDSETPWIFLQLSVISALAGSMLFWYGSSKNDHPKLSRYRILVAVPLVLLSLWGVFHRWQDLQNLNAILKTLTC